jgi:hypothetical protein
LRSKSVDGAQKGSAARNVTETKFIWKTRKLKRPYKRTFLIQMALHVRKVLQRDQQGLKLLAANDSKIFPKYENFLGVSVGTRCKL